MIFLEVLGQGKGDSAGGFFRGGNSVFEIGAEFPPHCWCSEAQQSDVCRTIAGCFAVLCVLSGLRSQDPFSSGMGAENSPYRNPPPPAV